MATKKKAQNPIDVEFVELMSETPNTMLPGEEPVENSPSPEPGESPVAEDPILDFQPDEIKKSSRWVEFIDEDNYHLLIDLNTIQAIEELADGFQNDLFTDQELIDQPLWNKGVILHFNIKSDDPIVLYGHDYDDIKELLTNL